MVTQINLGMHHQHGCIVTTPLYKKLQQVKYTDIEMSFNDRCIFASLLNETCFASPIVCFNFKFYQVTLCGCIKRYSDNSEMRNYADFVSDALNVDSRGSTTMFWGKKNDLTLKKSLIEENHVIYHNGYSYSTEIPIKDCIDNILNYPDYLPYDSHKDVKSLWFLNKQNIERYFGEELSTIKKINAFKLTELIIKKLTK